MKPALPFATLALLLPLVAAAAQDVWRCGTDGRSYSSVPCAEGRRVEVPEPRPAADVAEAQRRAAEERRQADALMRERMAREAAQRGSGLAGIGPRTEELKPVTPAKKSTTKAQRSRTAA